MTNGRRKLTAIDDPLATGPPAPPALTPRPPRARDEPTVALYARIRPGDADRLARAAFELGVHKRVLVGALIDRYVDGASKTGRQDLRELIDSYRAIELSDSSA